MFVRPVKSKVRVKLSICDQKFWMCLNPGKGSIEGIDVFVRRTFAELRRRKLENVFQVVGGSQSEVE